jgi:hypothetical protein
MRTEREFEAGAAITIALAIIPMNWLAYLSLSLILTGLVVRILWISISKRWERWAAIVGAVALLIVLTGPELLQRVNLGVQ